jgi:hypothetical protein
VGLVDGFLYTSRDSHCDELRLRVQAARVISVVKRAEKSVESLDLSGLPNEMLQ